MSERVIHTKLEPSCLFPDDEELGRLIMGPKRAHEFPAIAKAEEKRGFPPVSAIYGGRYWPAVVEFYRHRWMQQQEEGDAAMVAADERSKENWGLIEWKAEQAARKAKRAAAAAAKGKPIS
ncbi:hypothetical protein [Bosea sp. (in: a-proteobacteria)]|uniref:hypothetical protein n=1 Tax=Bosea sp. (in: a-proteobacteria) TaxID=1871050 RepID=UPI003B3A71B6